MHLRQIKCWNCLDGYHRKNKTNTSDRCHVACEYIFALYIANRYQNILGNFLDWILRVVVKVSIIICYHSVINYKTNEWNNWMRHNVLTYFFLFQKTELPTIWVCPNPIYKFCRRVRRIFFEGGLLGIYWLGSKNLLQKRVFISSNWLLSRRH